MFKRLLKLLGADSGSENRAGVTNVAKPVVSADAKVGSAIPAAAIDQSATVIKPNVGVTLDMKLAPMVNNSKEPWLSIKLDEKSIFNECLIIKDLSYWKQLIQLITYFLKTQPSAVIQDSGITFKFANHDAATQCSNLIKNAADTINSCYFAFFPHRYKEIDEALVVTKNFTIGIPWQRISLMIDLLSAKVAAQLQQQNHIVNDDEAKLSAVSGTVRLAQPVTVDAPAAGVAVVAASTTVNAVVERQSAPK